VEIHDIIIRNFLVKGLLLLVYCICWSCLLTVTH